MDNEIRRERRVEVIYSTFSPPPPFRSISPPPLSPRFIPYSNFQDELPRRKKTDIEKLKEIIAEHNTQCENEEKVKLDQRKQDIELLKSIISEHNKQCHEEESKRKEYLKYYINTHNKTNTILKKSRGNLSNSGDDSNNNNNGGPQNLEFELDETQMIHLISNNKKNEIELLKEIIAEHNQLCEEEEQKKMIERKRDIELLKDIIDEHNKHSEMKDINHAVESQPELDDNMDISNKKSDIELLKEIIEEHNTHYDEKLPVLNNAGFTSSSSDIELMKEIIAGHHKQCEEEEDIPRSKNGTNISTKKTDVELMKQIIAEHNKQCDEDQKKKKNGETKAILQSNGTPERSTKDKRKKKKKKRTLSKSDIENSVIINNNNSNNNSPNNNSEPKKKTDLELMQEIIAEFNKEEEKKVVNEPVKKKTDLELMKEIIEEYNTDQSGTPLTHSLSKSQSLGSEEEDKKPLFSGRLPPTHYFDRPGAQPLQNIHPQFLSNRTSFSTTSTTSIPLLHLKNEAKKSPREKTPRDKDIPSSNTRIENNRIAKKLQRSSKSFSHIGYTAEEITVIAEEQKKVYEKKEEKKRNTFFKEKISALNFIKKGSNIATKKRSKKDDDEDLKSIQLAQSYLPIPQENGESQAPKKIKNENDKKKKNYSIEEKYQIISDEEFEPSPVININFDILNLNTNPDDNNKKDKNDNNNNNNNNNGTFVTLEPNENSNVNITFPETNKIRKRRSDDSELKKSIIDSSLKKIPSSKRRKGRKTLPEEKEEKKIRKKVKEAALPFNNYFNYNFNYEETFNNMIEDMNLYLKIDDEYDKKICEINQKIARLFHLNIKKSNISSKDEDEKVANDLENLLGKYDEEYNKSISQNANYNKLSHIKEGIMWNHQFQSTFDAIYSFDYPLDSPTSPLPIESKVEVYEKFERLVTEYSTKVEKYGKIIISEISLPHHLKSFSPLPPLPPIFEASSSVSFSLLPPLSSHCYFIHGIYFQLIKEEEKEKIKELKLLEKKAKEIVSSIDHLYYVKSKNINLPLISVIKYRGFSLFAHSCLPLPLNSPYYLFDPSNINNINNNEKNNQNEINNNNLNNLIEEKELNSTELEIISSHNLQIHKGVDDRLYVLPLFNKDNQKNAKIRFEFRSRINLLNNYNNDNFNDLSMDRKNEEICKEFRDLLSKENPSYYLPFDFIQSFHRMGLSLRSLSLLFSLCYNNNINENNARHSISNISNLISLFNSKSNPNLNLNNNNNNNNSNKKKNEIKEDEKDKFLRRWARMILIEMTARTIKEIVRNYWKSIANHYFDHSDYHFKLFLLYLFSYIFSNNSHKMNEKNDNIINEKEDEVDKENYWRNVIYPFFIDKYYSTSEPIPFQLLYSFYFDNKNNVFKDNQNFYKYDRTIQNANNNPNDVAVFPTVYLLFLRVQNLLGISFNEISNNSFLISPTSFFTGRLTNLLSAFESSPIIRHSSIGDYVKAISLLGQVKSSKFKDFQESLKLNLCSSRFRRLNNARNSRKGSENNIQKKDFIQQKSEISLLFNLSLEKLENVIRTNTTNQQIICNLANVNKKIKNDDRAKIYYLIALNLRPNNVALRFKYAKFLHFQLNSMGEAEDEYLHCIQLNRDCSKAKLHYILLLLEIGETKDAKNLFTQLDANSIYEKHSSLHQFLSSCFKSFVS